MGIGGISVWQLAIILVIVVMLFGTKRLRGLGGDLGSAIKGFKKAMSDDNSDTENKDDTNKTSNKVEDNSRAAETSMNATEAEKTGEKK